MYDIRMRSDYFYLYTSTAPSFYYSDGIRKGIDMQKLLTYEFDIEQEGIKTGVARLIWLVYNFYNDRSTLSDQNK